MARKVYNVIGLMSGTSLDGLDIVYMNFSLDLKWEFEVLISETISYSDYWFKTLRGLVNNSIEELKEIDLKYTQHLGVIINNFVENNNITKVDFISSHGHTALHQPDDNYTLQIGNLPILSKLIDKTVICDFRVQDVELGGQGAPLVPIGDELLFSEYDFCINLGGFANLSTIVENKRIAYDICPANIVLNRYVEDLGLKFDNGGQLASEGELNNNLLQALNDLPFYKQEFPKSLGLEWVDQFIFPLIDSYKMDTKSILRTAVAHIATQISIAIQTKKEASALVTGGGAFNSFLIKEIQKKTTHSLTLPSKEIIDYKEAIIFGFLGVLKSRNEINVLQSVTGARKDHSSGKIFHP